MSTISDKKDFFLDNLCRLVTSEYEEIFRILKSNDGEWSENCNGIFFDLNRIDDILFNKLYAFLEYCLTQRDNDAKRLESMDAFKKEIKIEEPKSVFVYNNKSCPT